MCYHILPFAYATGSTPYIIIPYLRDEHPSMPAIFMQTEGDSMAILIHKSRHGFKPKPKNRALATAQDVVNDTIFHEFIESLPCTDFKVHNVSSDHRFAEWQKDKRDSRGVLQSSRRQTSGPAAIPAGVPAAHHGLGLCLI